MWLKTITQNRTYTITVVLFVAAFLICGAAWARFFAVIATNPSPVRYVDFVTETGEQAPFRQECAGPAFVEVDRVWRFCAYDVAGIAWGMVRFDLNEGKGRMLWPLPESPDSQPLALARAPGGELALAWGAPEMAAIYRLLPEGGVLPIGAPPDALARIGGLAWVDGAVELVTANAHEIRLHTYADGAWTSPRPVPPPADCSGEAVCAFQFAWRDDSVPDWQFLYVIAPTAGTDPADPVRFVQGDAIGAAEVLATLTLADLGPEHLRLDEAGRLAGFDTLFDQASGGVVNWSMDTAPFVDQDGAWTRMKPPPGSTPDSFYFSNYEIADGGLKWIPGLRYPFHGWHVESWMMLQQSGEGLALAEYAGEQGPVLTADKSMLLSENGQICLLPASDGGYWVIGPSGAYLKADDSMGRADSLDLVERVQRAYDQFGRLGTVSDDFYREQRVLKMAAFPLVLLSLPAGYLLVFFVRQRRRDRRAWLLLLAQVSTAYMVLATIFMWWFWELTSDF